MWGLGLKMGGVLLDHGIDGCPEPVVANCGGTEDLLHLREGGAALGRVGVAIADLALDHSKELDLVTGELNGSQLGSQEGFFVFVVVHGDIIVESELGKELLGEGPLGSFG